MRIAIGAGGLGCASWAGYIGYSVANGSPLLLRFFRTVLPKRYAAEMGLATRHKLRRNNTSIMMFDFLTAALQIVDITLTVRSLRSSTVPFD